MIMNANIFTPHRLDGESFKQYRARRAASKRAAEQLTLTGAFSHFGNNTSRQELRDAQRKSGAMKKIAGAFGRGMRNWCNRREFDQYGQRFSEHVLRAGH